MKYIDAEKLKAEIEGLKQSNTVRDNEDYAQYELDVACGYDMACEEILHSITSLQQEQLDIDKIKREWYNRGYLEGRKNAHTPARELGLPKSLNFQQEQPEVDLEKEIEMFGTDERPTKDDLISFARHFYELGLNARKGD